MDTRDRTANSERIMHLNECFQLAFSRPTADALALVENGANAALNSFDYPENDQSFFDDTSSMQAQQLQHQIVEGSVVSVVKCIASEWLSKSQTNFYIPPEHYAGYSYLFEDGKQSGHTLDTRIPQSIHHNTQLHFHEHRRAFVYAEESINLHPHHYDVYTHNSTDKMPLTAMHSSINLTVRESDSSIFTSQNANSNINPAPMTVPYIHPHLEIPVPPLQLPLYFGLLCWSYILAGVVFLKFPQKWLLCGGSSGKGEEYGRHWFPYRAFAWALILLQSPCSFLADYVHMTNNSPWHAIDRFIACFMLSLELVKLLVMGRYTRPFIYSLNLICTGVAMFCFVQSQKSQQILNEDGFVFWHCGWHCYPIMASIVHLLEIFLNQRWGEYYSFECDAEEKGESCGILLSTFAMKCWNNTGVKQPKVQYEMPIDATPKRVKAKRVMRHDQETAASLSDTNGMTPPGVRRSRRVAGQKPEIQPSL